MARVSEENQARKIELLEELKIKVRPKMIVVNRELADMSSLFKDFDGKN